MLNVICVSGVHIVPLYVNMLMVSCCDARLDYRLKMMLGYFTPSVLVGGFMSYLCFFACGVQHVFSI